MASYANSFTPPEWWVTELERIAKVDRLNDRMLADRANIEAPGNGWDRTRLHKMRSGTIGWTMPIVRALSCALKIPSPVVVPHDLEEAQALERWLHERRVSTKIRSEKSERTHTVAQALDAAVKDAKDQTLLVDSVGEGSPRSPRTRRAPPGG